MSLTTATLNESDDNSNWHQAITFSDVFKTKDTNFEVNWCVNVQMKVKIIQTGIKQ